MGYAGGSTRNPNYNNIGDYIETVQLDYDPARISYEELLDIFWQSAPADVAPYTRQYTSVIFYSSDAEKTLAVKSVQDHEKAAGHKIYVQVLPMTAFYPAEAYHQKYYLRGSPDLFNELKLMYPDDADLNNSTAAMRINSYAAGLGDADVFNAEINSYGLSAGAINHLKDMGNNLFPAGSGKSCAAVQ